VSKRNQTVVPLRLERVLTAMDADYILNDDGGGCFFHQRLAGEE
jgi:hypothetical protein